MKSHPLKLVSVVSLVGLFLSQAGLLLWLDGATAWIAALLLGAPLLLPLKGLIQDRRYTYKWVGFVTLFYVAVGVSESFINPALRLYGVFTLTFSCLLFFGSIYYSRYLRDT